MSKIQDSLKFDDSDLQPDIRVNITVPEIEEIQNGRVRQSIRRKNYTNYEYQLLPKYENKVFKKSFDNDLKMR